MNYPLCTIAETPRLPEHCIEYAVVVLWEQRFPTQKMNRDSPADMQWVFEQAKAHSLYVELEIASVVRTAPPPSASPASLISSRWAW